jgi:sulfhydrogenase subunit gamma (sulfur reductase)
MSGSTSSPTGGVCDSTQNPNLYIPQIAEIIFVREEVKGARAVKTFRFRFTDEKVQRSFTYRPGQCALLSVFGKGEAMIAITSTPLIKDYLEFTVMKQGRVTSALHEMQVGDTIGIRGPFGNGFPLEDWIGKNIVFIGGGTGQPPIRGLMNTCLRRRREFGKLTMIYGARTSADLVFKEEIQELLAGGEIEVRLSIDVAEKGWPHFVGFVPTNVMEVKPDPKNTIAVTCGPPIMIKFVVMNLEKLGFTDEQIYTTLEGKMKCGLGKCGRCNVGKIYICKDGPVFSWKALKSLPQEY